MSLLISVEIKSLFSASFFTTDVSTDVKAEPIDIFLANSAIDFTVHLDNPNADANFGILGISDNTATNAAPFLSPSL